MPSQISKPVRITAVPFTKVRPTDSFWAPRIARNRETSLPHALAQCDKTGRFANFENASKRLAGADAKDGFKGFYFNDSDVYKMLEGVANMLAIQRDAGLDTVADDLISRVAAAQEKDGYLYTARTLCGADYMPPGGKERWSDLGAGHELYCVGHLYEAAAAHFAATGKRNLLNIAVRNADLVCKVFGPGPGKLRTPDGHPEVEIGLMKLAKATGNKAYADLAKFFIERRGDPSRKDRIGEYAQDHKPLVQQTEAVGHAVRAAYLYSGASDVATQRSDPALAAVVDRLWDDVVAGKIYVTGGIGSRGSGEAFGDRYELPNRTAYAETCASIAMVLWCQRQFERHGDSKYVDVLERTLYNGLISGVSADGKGFFYTNPLESRSGSTRPAWHDCACCPPNVLRFLPTVPGFAYAVAGNTVHVNLYLASTADIAVGNGTLRLIQTGNHPWDGNIGIRVESPKPLRCTVKVRIPGWARGEAMPSDLYRFADKASGKVRLTVNGKPVEMRIERGYVAIDRSWKSGDQIGLELPMEPRRVVAHPGVVADRGRVALQRGPLVYCAEGIDQAGKGVLARFLPDSEPIRTSVRSDWFGGTVILETSARETVRDSAGNVAPGASSPLRLVPYACWANRERGEMAVWMAREPGAAQLPPLPTYARTARWSASGGTGLESVRDQQEPASSIDHANPFFHWWPRKGTAEWVQADLTSPARIAGVSVYWFDDTGIGECRLPASWKVKLRVDGNWVDVQNTTPYGTASDSYNTVAFAPQRADAVRLEIQLPAGFAAGIHEVRILDERKRELP